MFSTIRARGCYLSVCRAILGAVSAGTGGTHLTLITCPHSLRWDQQGVDRWGDRWGTGRREKLGTYLSGCIKGRWLTVGHFHDHTSNL